VKHSIYKFRRFNLILLNSTSLINFYQVLPDQSNSTKNRQRPRTYVRTHRPPRPLTTYLSDSLIIPFLFFTQRPIPSKSYIPSDLDRIYIIPSNLS
jgi:hypothetical protein